MHCAAAAAAIHSRAHLHARLRRARRQLPYKTFINPVAMRQLAPPPRDDFIAARNQSVKSVCVCVCARGCGPFGSRSIESERACVDSRPLEIVRGCGAFGARAAPQTSPGMDGWRLLFHRSRVRSSNTFAHAQICKDARCFRLSLTFQYSVPRQVRVHGQRQRRRALDLRFSLSAGAHAVWDVLTHTHTPDIHG